MTTLATFALAFILTVAALAAADEVRALVQRVRGRQPGLEGLLRRDRA
jgi:cell division septation protein DedD